MITKMIVIFDQNKPYWWPKWQFHVKNDRCMTNLTDIFDQNDHY